MAQQNPFLPGECRQGMEDHRTRNNKEEANRRYARKLTRFREQARVVREEQAALLGDEPEVMAVKGDRWSKPGVMDNGRK